jgi:hypothetical protein
MDWARTQELGPSHPLRGMLRGETHAAQEVLEARGGTQEARAECLPLLVHVLRVSPVNPVWVHRTLTLFS